MGGRASTYELGGHAITESIAAATFVFEDVLYIQGVWHFPGHWSLRGPTVWFTEQVTPWGASCPLRVAWPRQPICSERQSGRGGGHLSESKVCP